MVLCSPVYKPVLEDFRFRIFSVSVGGAIMNIHEFPRHASGSENFSSRSLHLSRFNGKFQKGKYILHVALNYICSSFRKSL